MTEHSPDLKAIFEALPGHVVLLAPDAPFYRVVAISEQWLQTIGQRREQVVGKSIGEVYPENLEQPATGPSRLSISLQQALANKQPARPQPVVRYQVPTADGAVETRYWSAQSRPVVDEAGNVCYLIHTLQDSAQRPPHEPARPEHDAQHAADLAGMRRLYELQAKLADQPDVQAALRDVLALACEFTHTDRGCVQLLSADGQRLEMAVWKGYPDDSPFISFFRYEGLATGCEVTRVQRQRLIIEETVGFPGLAGTEAGAATYADGIRAAQSTPMTSRADETIGVISTQFRQPHRPSEHALRLLDMLAWTAAEFLERHRAEAALRASEEQFRTVANLVPDLLWRSSAGGETSWYNQRWYEYTGQTPAEAAAYGWTDVIHPDDRAQSAQRYHEAVRNGQPLQQEHRIRSAAGEYRWFLVQVLPVRDEQGRVAECFGAATDIHQLKLAEAAMVADNAWLEREVAARTRALGESRQLLQSVFDTSLISMLVLRAVRDEAGAVQDFRILMGNRELAKATGRPDLAGKLYSQEFPGVRLTPIYERMLEVLATGEPAEMEFYYPHEGIHIWCASQFVKLDDGLVVANLDITERKQAEAKIQEQAHFIARVNETLPDLMTVSELPSGRVVYINRDPHEAPGFEREKVLNAPLEAQTALLRMHPDDAARLPDYFVRAAALGDHEIATFRYRARFDTDSWRWFQVRGSVFQRDPATGAATQVLSVSQDVTARIEAEQQQAKAYQLLEQSEEVASLGSWEYDRDTGEFLWSAGMYRLFGLPPGSPVSPEIYLLFAIAEDQPAAARLVQGITSGRTGFGQTLRITVNGVVKTLRVKAAVVLDEAGKRQRTLGVDLDISEVQRLEADNLRLRLSQQQALFHAVLDAEEVERRRLAESLHNGLGQTLFAAKLQLNQLLAGPAPEALRRADQLLADAIRQTRTLSHELVPTVLSDFGLPAALQDIARKFSGLPLRLACTVDLDEQYPLPMPLQVALYRMAQELAQNVVKHAHATAASLALETVPGFVLLRVEDNGVGFSAGPPTGPGLGLRTIRDRVALLGGTVDLGSSPAFGTYVRLRIPLPSPSSPPAA